MGTFMSDAGRPAYYTISETAWILGVEPSRVSRLIRVGTLHGVPRNGRVMVPSTALTGLLGEPVDKGSASGGATW